MKKMVVVFFSIFSLVNLTAAEKAGVTMKCKVPYQAETRTEQGTFVYCEGVDLYFPEEARIERITAFVCKRIPKDQNQFSVVGSNGKEINYIRNAEGFFSEVSSESNL